MSKLLTILDSVPCKVCGQKPILSGTGVTRRLVCPNYKSTVLIHGNGNTDRLDLPRGFTGYSSKFLTMRQSEEGIHDLVQEWNYLHQEG